MSNKIYDAVRIAHCSTKDIPCCEEHLKEVLQASRYMGLVVLTSSAPVGLKCEVCKSYNEEDEV